MLRWLFRKQPNLESVEELWGKASVALKNAEFREAIEIYSKLIEVDPTQTNSLINRAFCYKKLGRFAEEESDRLSAFRHGKEQTPEKLGDLAICFLNQNKDDSAAEYLEKALAKRPNWNDLNKIGKIIYNRLSLSATENQQFEESLYFAEKALAFSPDNPDLQRIVELCREEVRLRVLREDFEGRDEKHSETSKHMCTCQWCRLRFEFESSGAYSQGIYCSPKCENESKSNRGF